MTERVDCVVIGAGVVGLACARALALDGREVIVLEAAAAIGTGTSSRNSEVIHAGIYYAGGSLKARLCVQGKAQLYRYCRERAIACRRLGKVIVATDAAQRSQLQVYYDRAPGNGVDDLQWLDRAQLRALEPQVSGDCALLSPSTGIVDSHALMLSLLGDMERCRGTLVCNSPVTAARVCGDGIELAVGGREAMRISATTVVNCAGLYAVDVAASVAGLDPAAVPAAYYAKGHYFTLSGKSPFQRLVYPLADGAGLGIHVTLDMQGQVRFGPDVQWQQNRDYSFDHSRKPAFVEAIRRYYPALDAGRLQPGYTGIRPKLAPAGQGPRDFMIQDAAAHGAAGLINLFGIESPGLTASLAIADRIAAVAGAA